MVRRPTPWCDPHSKYLKYMRDHQNIRIYASAEFEVFPRTAGCYRTGQEIAEKILQNLDVKTLLLSQRTCRFIRDLIRAQLHLQRRLWFCDMFTVPPIRPRESPTFVDPLIRGIRVSLDIFIEYDVNQPRQKILYMPHEPLVKLDDSPYASWRRMAVMRSSARGLV